MAMAPRRLSAVRLSPFEVFDRAADGCLAAHATVRSGDDARGP